MGNYKLIPLNGEFLLIDTQAEIVSNDYAYEHLIIESDPSNDKKIAINKKSVRQCKWVGDGLIGFTDGDTTGLGWCKKVIASMYIPELPIISKSDILPLYEALPSNLEILKRHCKVLTDGNVNDEDWSKPFITGVNAVLGRINSISENKEAKYTEEDLRKAYRQGSFDSYAMARTMHKKEKAYNSVDEYLPSVLPATVTERFCEIEWINDGFGIKILRLI